MPGSTNKAADAASRNPSTTCAGLSLDIEEQLITAAISKELQESMTITWDQLLSETSKDRVLSNLVHVIESGCEFSNPLLNEYLRYRDALYVNEGVVMYQDRVVVPSRLRPVVVQHLHAAHQGVSSMEQRAHSMVFWPGMTADIRSVRADCYYCNKNSPSHSPLPSIVADPPSTPFEKVFGDFFNFGGHHFLVIGCPVGPKFFRRQPVALTPEPER